MGETLDHFGYICKIEKSIASEIQMRLKESVCIMDELNLSDVKIRRIYLEEEREDKSFLENLESFEQLERIKEFIGGINKDELEWTFRLELTYEIAKVGGKRLRE